MTSINSNDEKSSLTNETNTKINDRKDNSVKDEEDINLKKSDEYNRFRNILIEEANFDPYTAKMSSCKRQDYIQWEDYFMAVAYLSSQRSKDPNIMNGTKTDSEIDTDTYESIGGGACIVDSDNRIVGIGYNGFPRGCSDDYLPWTNGTQGDKIPFLHTKNPFMCYAEVNAILNKCSVDVKGAKMYVLQYPNNESAKIIIQSGIREIIYMKEPNPTNEIYSASKIMFAMAGVKTRLFQPLQKKILLDFGCSQEETTEKDVDKDLSRISSSNIHESFLSCNEETGKSDRESIKNLLQKEANYDIDNIPSYAKKRTSYLSWDDYFLAVSFLSAKRSKDPNTQVGACIVNRDNRIVGIGYNGFPRGCSDDFLPWARRDSKGTLSSQLQTKYPYVCHAEVNAILNKCSADVVGSTLYVALFPCNDCAKMIIQAGIREIVYLNDYYHETDQCRASRIMFAMAGVKLRHHKPRKRILEISLG